MFLLIPSTRRSLHSPPAGGSVEMTGLIDGKTADIKFRSSALLLAARRIDNSLPSRRYSKPCKKRQPIRRPRIKGYPCHLERRLPKRMRRCRSREISLIQLKSLNNEVSLVQHKPSTRRSLHSARATVGMTGTVGWKGGGHHILPQNHEFPARRIDNSLPWRRHSKPSKPLSLIGRPWI